ADEIGMNTSVLVFALTASILAGLLFSVAPALSILRVDLHEALRGRGQIEARRRESLLVIAQIAFALTLVMSTGLLVRSLNQFIRVDPGYDPGNILTMTTLIYDHSTAEAKLNHYQQIVERVRSLPGVEATAMVSTVPLSSPVQNVIYSEAGSAASKS